MSAALNLAHEHLAHEHIAHDGQHHGHAHHAHHAHHHQHHDHSHAAQELARRESALAESDSAAYEEHIPAQLRETLRDSIRENIAQHDRDSQRTSLLTAQQEVDDLRELARASMVDAMTSQKNAGREQWAEKEKPNNPAFRFVDEQPFQLIIIALILLNMYALARETDDPNMSQWPLLNVLFTLAFVIEFLLRLVYRGPLLLLWTGKNRRWMVYDLFVIVLGVLDLSFCYWAGGLRMKEHDNFTGYAESGGVHHHRGASYARELLPTEAPGLLLETRRLEAGGVVDIRILRLLQMSRLLRIFRIFRMSKKFYNFIGLLLQMFRAFGFLLSLIFVICFILSIILTRLIGHGLIVNTKDEDLSETVRSMFSSMDVSLFSLFQLTTADDWARIALPVIQLHPAWQIFFVLFIAFMSWTMLSLLTAVASETMITASSSKKQEEVTMMEMKREGFITFMCAEFIKADFDGNGVLDKDEFASMMSSDRVKQELAIHGIQTSDADIIKTWDTFDVDESGTLTIDELVAGFAYLQEQIATKHVANIGYAMKRFNLRIEHEMDNLLEGIAHLAEMQTNALQAVQRQYQLPEFCKPEEDDEDANEEEKGSATD